MIVHIMYKAGYIMFSFRGHRTNFPGHGIILFHFPAAFQAEGDTVFFRYVGILHFSAVADKQPADIPILTHLVNQLFRKVSCCRTQLYIPVSIQRFDKSASGEADMAAFSVKLFSFLRRPCIHEDRRIPHKEHIPAVLTKAFQPGNGGIPKCFISGNQNYIIAHFTHMEFPVFRCFILIRQKGFRHEIKIKLGEEKPFRHIGEPAFQFFPDQSGLLLRSIVEPIAFNRMYYGHAHVRFSSC